MTDATILQICTNPNERDTWPIDAGGGARLIVATIDMAHRMACEAAQLWEIGGKAGTWRDSASKETLELVEALEESDIAKFMAPT